MILMTLLLHLMNFHVLPVSVQFFIKEKKYFRMAIDRHGVILHQQRLTVQSMFKNIMSISQRAPLKLMEFSFPVMTILPFAYNQRMKYQRMTLEEKKKKRLRGKKWNNLYRDFWASKTFNISSVFPLSIFFSLVHMRMLTHSKEI